MKSIVLRAIALFTLIFSGLNVGAQVSYVTIPDGNPSSGSVRQPLGTWWGFERSHMLYLASEIGRGPDEISGLAFYVASVSSPGDAPTQIYLKNSVLNSITPSTVAAAITGATLVFDATIPGSALIANEWINIDFDTPFEYTGGNLEVIVLTNATGTGNEGSLGKRFRYSTVTGRFQFWNADNTPPTGNGTASGNRPNIRLTFPPLSGVDLALTGLAAPGLGCYSDSEELSVAVQNNSFTDHDFSVYPAFVVVTANTPSGTYFYEYLINEGVLPAGQSLNILLDAAFSMADAGTYSFSGTIDVFDDQAPGNNAFSASRTVAANRPLSIVQNFSGYNGSNLPSLAAPNDGWAEASGPVNPLLENGLWTTPPTNQAAVMGGPSARFNVYSINRHGWIVSPQFVATDATEISFDAAIFAFNTTAFSGIGSDDVFAVRISTDCGLSYQNLLAFTQSTQSELGLTNAPTRFTIDLAAYAGQQLRIAFFASSGTVSNPEDFDVHVANVVIRNRPAFDLAAGALAGLDTRCYNGSVPIAVSLSNQGVNDFDFSVSPVTVTVNVTSPSGSVETLSVEVSEGILAAGAQTNVNVGSLPASLAGNYAFSVSLSSQADEDASNNAFNNALILSVAQAEALQNFTAYTGSNILSLAVPNNGFSELIVSGGSLNFGESSWTASNATQTTYFGSTTARINLWSNFNRGGILSAPVTVEANTKVFFDLALTMWNGTANTAMGSDDVFQVYVATNCGENVDLIYELNAGNKDAQGVSNQFKRIDLDICQYAGQAVEIIFFASDGLVDDAPDYDVHLDNIRVGGQEVCNLPTNLTINALTSTTATVSWAAVEQAKEYEVRWRPLIGGTWSAWVGAGTSATITGLTPQIRYIAQVRALCTSCGFGSEYSALVSFTTPAVPVEACVNPEFGVTPSGQNTAVVSWTPVAGAFNYIIQWKRADVSGVWTTVQRSAALDPTLTLTGLTPGAVYIVRVRTRCSNALAPIPAYVGFAMPLGRFGLEQSVSASVYPNPSSGVFTFKFDSAVETPVQIALYDLAGKTVYSQTFIAAAGANSLTVGKESLAKGVYVLRAVAGSTVFSEKVVVE